MPHIASIDILMMMTGRGNKFRLHHGLQKLELRHWVLGAFSCLQICEIHATPLLSPVTSVDAYANICCLVVQNVQPRNDTM